MKTAKRKEGWKFFVGIFVGMGIIVVLLLASMISSFSSPFTSKIAIIKIRGTIASGHSLLSETVTPDDALPLIQKAEEDASIKAVMFDIDSPGGSVVASREIAYAVAEMKKPTLCWMGDVAASGAYWIASSCDYIMADPLTLTGSVGVTASYLEFSKLFEKYGITYEQITSGESKDVGSPFRNMTTGERSKMEYIVNETFTYFITDVVSRRNLTQPQIDTIKTGDIFLGKDAIALGLIDATGTLSDAREKAKSLANDKNANFVSLQKSGLSIFDLLGMLG
ncbi:MAG: signal peptide peptidase SppA [Candidatus Aenigmatarchaeota archaeon]